MGLGIAGALFEEFCNDGGLLLPSVVILALLAGYSASASYGTPFGRIGLTLFAILTRCARIGLTLFAVLGSVWLCLLVRDGYFRFVLWK